MLGASFVLDFGSKVMGLRSGCIEDQTDFNCGIHFNIKGICPTYTYHLGLSDLDNKINIEIMQKIQKIQKCLCDIFEMNF